MNLEEAQTLVLDCGFRPIASISWQRAIIMLMSDKARVVENYKIEIRSQNISIECPSVISLSAPSPFNRSMVTFSRNNIFARDKMTCQYCGNKFKKKDLTLDHVVPQSRGGKTNWENIVSSCLPCNSKKSDKSLIQVGYKLKNDPKKPKAINWIFKFDDFEVPDIWQKYLDYSGFA